MGKEAVVKLPEGRNDPCGFYAVRQPGSLFWGEGRMLQTHRNGVLEVDWSLKGDLEFARLLLAGHTYLYILSLLPLSPNEPLFLPMAVGW